MAVAFAANDKSDADNIRMLGEGWTGEEAWAIALYCAVRHVGSIEEASLQPSNMMVTATPPVPCVATSWRHLWI